MDAHHSTGMLPGFLNRSRILVGSEPRGAALKLKSIMADVKIEGRCRKLQKDLIDSKESFTTVLIEAKNKKTILCLKYCLCLVGTLKVSSDGLGSLRR